MLSQDEFVFTDADPVLEIASSGELGTLRLYALGDAGSGYAAEVSTGLLTARVHVGVHRERVASYFSGLAEDWRGWDGMRELSLLPPASDYAAPVLTLAASADGRGHTTFVVKLASPWIPTSPLEAFDTHVGPGVMHEAGSWAVVALLSVEAMALDEIATQAAALPYDDVGRW